MQIIISYVPLKPQGFTLLKNLLIQNGYIIQQYNNNLYETIKQSEFNKNKTGKFLIARPIEITDKHLDLFEKFKHNIEQLKLNFRTNIEIEQEKAELDNIEYILQEEHIEKPEIVEEKHYIYNIKSLKIIGYIYNNIFYDDKLIQKNKQQKIDNLILALNASKKSNTVSTLVHKKNTYTSIQQNIHIYKKLYKNII